jgi:hypothetical protein
MERLGFSLPEFTRLAWVSDEARRVWEPRLWRINEAWRDIEWRAIVAGVRRCAVAVVTPEALVARALRWAGAGLAAVPLEMLQISGQPYEASAQTAQPGEPFTFRVVVGSPDDVARFGAAWREADQETIGDLLGYPTCCRQFFQRVWVDDAMVDTTWPMAVASVDGEAPSTCIEVQGPAQANILWRWLGPRAVPHLPCRFDCRATVAFADELVEVGRAAGYAVEMDWLLTVLDWPVEWSALHGIAEIKTPIVKVSTATDATATKYTVRRRGHPGPAETPRGLGFPWEAPVKLRLTGTRGYRRGLHNAGTPAGVPQPAWYATDNGFRSVASMQDAHRPIVELARSVLTEDGGRVLDLGCGNGALLEQLVMASTDIVPFGVDVDERRIEHARRLQPAYADHFVVGDLFDDLSLWSDEAPFALVILMPGRLLEAPAAAARLRDRLEASASRLLVYAYADWLGRPGGLRNLTERAGLALVGDARQDSVALATIPVP